MNKKERLSKSQAAKFLGVDLRSVDDWVEMKLLEVTVDETAGPGHQKYFFDKDYILKIRFIFDQAGKKVNARDLEESRLHRLAYEVLGRLRNDMAVAVHPDAFTWTADPDQNDEKPSLDDIPGATLLLKDAARILAKNTEQTLDLLTRQQIRRYRHGFSEDEIIAWLTRNGGYYCKEYCYEVTSDKIDYVNGKFVSWEKASRVTINGITFGTADSDESLSRTNTTYSLTEVIELIGKYESSLSMADILKRLSTDQ